MTFIAMANSDNLSRPTDLGSGDALSSPVGMAFLKNFIFPEKFGEPIPEINWNASSAGTKKSVEAGFRKPYSDIYTKDLITRFRINQSVGQATEATNG